MKVFLLYKEKDFNLQQELLWNEQDLTQDLELNTLFGTMAAGDEFLLDVSRQVILSPMDSSSKKILYRQDVLRDCMKNPDVIKEIFEIASEALTKEKNNYWGIFRQYPNSVLYRSIEVLEMFREMLKKLKGIADENANSFNSEGFYRLFDMLRTELSEDYFQEMKRHLISLKFREGVLMSARLGKGNKGRNYVLHNLLPETYNWWQRIIRFFYENFFKNDRGGIERDTDSNVSSYTFFISSRDEGGVRSLSELKDEGINLVANSLAQSNEYIHNFFTNLRTELAFYLGCLNLHEALSSLDEPVAFPEPVQSKGRISHYNGLYDVCLALNTKKPVIGNESATGDKKLVMITGANQGGKSTFLRSIGLAQVMMQAGMFVPANSFKASTCGSLITHFRREEDSGMKSGKLDEEMARMDLIIEKLSPDAMVLFNESFAATNEREGSEIALQIVNALLEYGVTVYFVTHLYEFARMFYDKKMNNALFLRAERQTDGLRTFKLTEGAPLETSYGADLYREVFVE